jgi:hypothetical protein
VLGAVRRYVERVHPPFPATHIGPVEFAEVRRMVAFRYAESRCLGKLSTVSVPSRPMDTLLLQEGFLFGVRTLQSKCWGIGLLQGLGRARDR